MLYSGVQLQIACLLRFPISVWLSIKCEALVRSSKILRRGVEKIALVAADHYGGSDGPAVGELGAADHSPSDATGSGQCCTIRTAGGGPS